MALAFDTLGYAKRLRDGGVSPDQAEAHAEAARDFIMVQLATKADLLVIRADLQAAVALLDTKIAHLEAKLDTKLDNLSLRLTVRLGVIVAAGIATLAALMRLG